MKMSNDFGAQSDDMEAIHVYMKGQVPKTPESTAIRSQYLKWFDGLGFWDKNWSGSAYDEARTRRNQYNLKNAVTPAEKAQVQTVLAQGMTTEQMAGKSRPVINVKTGAVGSQVRNPTVPGISPGLNRVLKLGVKPGDDVKQWQSFLGLTPPTGYFDSITDKKTRTYQTENGLKADGIVGAMTWAKAFPAVKKTPFVDSAQTASVASNINNAFKSPPKAASFAPSKSAPAFAPSKPTPTFAPSKSAPTSKPETPVTTHASMVPGLSDLDKLPFWAKILGALGLGGAVYYGAKQHEKNR
jgi:peptidoglycan hydrolase-like protein with peptidoglycan-binding domain